jgi:hypothetical protein
VRGSFCLLLMVFSTAISLLMDNPAIDQQHTNHRRLADLGGCANVDLSPAWYTHDMVCTCLVLSLPHAALPSLPSPLPCRLGMEGRVLLPHLLVSLAEGTKTLKRLLRAGADPNLQDLQGRTVSGGLNRVWNGDQ